ncbi:sigma-70 family RNA polymerase sigma factor [Chitinophaga horti]|uniref:Sigma-70 family RNA polymerase sigma factor n=1 Tax=Chitinophaga horti TaxID=2920382 RepID=A0ABY6IXZ0_9BACT|nr:sigma-70 family RNA polymerase sigma factor [Chitinophaga horti]UYQ92071.1 sigma-70 family RNA polymerase sigma factor [Chitinophaga horti]
MDQVDEELLLQCAKADDQLAQQMLYERYVKLLVYEANLILGDEEDAKDVVHDFFVDFFAKKRHVNIKENLGGYLYKAVRYCCMIVLRRRQYRGQFAESYKHIKEQVCNVTPGEGREIRENFDQLLAGMSRQPARALKLYLESDLRRKQVAVAMGISDNTVKTHISSGIKVLRKKMAEMR